MKTEKANFQEELSQLIITLSNPSDTISKTAKMVSKINYLWDSRGYIKKRKLQELVFPKGIIYDREIDDYRTIEVNEIFSAIGSFSSDSGNKKGGQSKNFLDLSALYLRPESNRHTLRYTILSRARLPVPPLRHSGYICLEALCAASDPEYIGACPTFIGVQIWLNFDF